MMAAQISFAYVLEHFIVCELWGRATSNKLARPSYMHVGLRSDSDWLIVEHSRITVGLLVCSSSRILPLLN